MKTYSTSTVKRGRQVKMKALIAHLALAVAAKKNPAMFSKYKLLRQKYLAIKVALIRQNLSAATQAARKYLATAK